MFWGDFIQAFALVTVALTGWLVPRLTTRGRLLLEINRLGNAIAKLPPSDARTSLETHLTERAAKLAAWLEPANRIRRLIQHGAGWGLWGAALAVTFFATPYLDSDPITQLWLLLPTVLIALFGYLAVLAVIELVWARRHPAGPRAGDAPVSG
jgi:hypothetical protein